MLRNDQGVHFLDVSTSGGFGHLQKGHGVSFADIDNDGDQDIYAQLGGMLAGDQFYNALFLNSGHDHRYLHVKLIGTETSRLAYGARIKHHERHCGRPTACPSDRDSATVTIYEKVTLSTAASTLYAMEFATHA